jgi:hypothetical protein
LSPIQTPGVVTEVMAVATPALSMSSIERSGVQFSVGGCSSDLSSATKPGETM